MHTDETILWYIDQRPDWLTASARYSSSHPVGKKAPRDSVDARVTVESINVALSNALGVRRWDLATVQPTKHYHYAYQSDDDGVFIQLGSEKQGILIQLQGRFWHKYRPSADFGKELLFLGFKPTRFDWSFTYQSAAAFKAGAVPTPEEKARHHGQLAELSRRQLGKKKPKQGMPVPTKDGYDTVYFARRTSAQFGRIYDKDYFDGAQYPALRYEMEWKRNMAMPTFEAWANGSTWSLTAQVLEWMYGAVSGAPHPLADWHKEHWTPVRPVVEELVSDRAAWFRGIVRKAFVKWAHAEPENAKRWLVEVEEDDTDLWTLPREPFVSDEEDATPNS